MRLLLALAVLTFSFPAFAFTDAGANQALADWEAADTYYFALLSSACSDTVTGTELSGNGYARQQITWGTPANRFIIMNGTITFTTTGVTWSEATHGAVYDAASGGVQHVCMPLNVPITVSSGSPQSFTGDGSALEGIYHGFE